MAHIQAKIPGYSGVWVQGKRQKYTSPSSLLLNVKVLRDIWASEISWVSEISFWVSVVLLFYIWFIMTVYYKMRQILLQNTKAILLQKATEVYNKMGQVFYYKMWQFYYKYWQLLQIATILSQNATVITRCDVHYKLRQHCLWWYY